MPFGKACGSSGSDLEKTMVKPGEAKLYQQASGQVHNSTTGQLPISKAGILGVLVQITMIWLD